MLSGLDFTGFGVSGFLQSVSKKRLLPGTFQASLRGFGGGGGGGVEVSGSKPWQPQSLIPNPMHCSSQVPSTTAKLELSGREGKRSDQPQRGCSRLGNGQALSISWLLSCAFSSNVVTCLLLMI